MAEIKKNALFGKLTPTAYKALEAAVVSCKMRGNTYVEIPHWIDQLLRQPDSDVAVVARGFKLLPDKLAVDTTNAVDKLARGATSISAFSAHITAAMEQAFLWSAVYFNAPRIRSGHLLIGLLKHENLREIILRISPEFEKISADENLSHRSPRNDSADLAQGCSPIGDRCWNVDAQGTDFPGHR